MKIQKADTEVFDRYTRPKLIEWLLSGISSWIIEDDPDSFYPHSFMNLFETPIEGIEQLYSVSSLRTKKPFRRAIARLGALCRPETTDAGQYDTDKRLALLKVFLRLTEYTRCFEAIEQVNAIAFSDYVYWHEEGFSDEVFASCLRCIGNIALKHSESTFWNNTFAPDLEDSLVRFSGAPSFKPAFAPYTLYALTTVNSKNLFFHLSLLGAQIASLHKHDHSQERLAHLTAARLIEEAPLQLFSHFSELSFRSKRSRDRWLIEALFSAQGPMELQRFGNDATKPRASLKGQPNKWIPVEHDDWMFFTPETVIDLPRKSFNPIMPDDSGNQIAVQLNGFFRSPPDHPRQAPEKGALQ